MFPKPLSSVELALSKCGRFSTSQHYVHRPEKVGAFTSLIRASTNKPLLARGAGRSCGDAALNSRGRILLTERLNRMLFFDQQSGILCCEAGVTFAEIVEVFVPRGWFLWVTPETKFVTLGGAIAFDIHGNNHHQNGSFSRYVKSLKLILTSGETVSCSQQLNSELFWATVGGMGLTGLITEVEIALRPIQTAYVNSYRFKARNIDEAIALFQEYEQQFQYVTAWIDCLATGQSLGRGIVMLGNHAEIADLSPNQQAEPLNLKPKYRVPSNWHLQSLLLKHPIFSTFNAFYYTSQRSLIAYSVAECDSFFYPLDFLAGRNQPHSRRGFVPYQCVFPLEVSQAALIKVLKLCSQEGWGSFLNTLKRLGPEVGWLSFPMSGYCLTLNMPLKPGLEKFLNELDQLVIHYGGRVYLAKDARLSPESFRQMYHNFPQWLAVKSNVDPDNLFASNLSRRLQIKSVVQ